MSWSYRGSDAFPTQDSNVCIHLWWWGHDHYMHRKFQTPTLKFTELCPSVGFPRNADRKCPRESQVSKSDPCRKMDMVNLSGVTPANQTKERSVHEVFTGAFRNKSSMWIVLVFLRKTPEFTKMGEIHELFVLALSWVCRGDPWINSVPQ